MESRRQHRLSLLSKLTFSLFVVLIILGGAVYPLWNIPSNLPEVSTLMSQVLLDRHGLPIQIPLNEREERALSIKLDEIPMWVQKAFILSEDKRFFDHFGVDIVAIFRAAFQSIKHFHIVSGASTISMQLTRIYWPKLSKPRFKIAQIVQALRLERFYSKSELLMYYFNVVPFGYQVVGLKQACLYFFNKSCDRLSLAEGATLAVLPRNPNFYLRNQNALLLARNRILKKIISHLRVDKISASQAFKEPIQFNHGAITTTAYHFSQKVLKEHKASSSTIIKTTLDLYLQKKIQSFLKEDIQKHPKLGDDGAILVVDNKSGDVLVYIGSPGYFLSGHGMLDAIQTFRSPGSTLKPFVYAYALERGWTLSSIVPDVPIKFKVENGIFSPNNYGGNFSGPQQLRYALANSKNVPVLYLTAKLGEASVLSFLRHVGFESLIQSSEHYGVGVSLGNGEVSLWELVQAYSGIARGGILKPLKLLDESFRSEEKRIISKEVAYLIADVLSDPQARAEEFGRNGALEFDFKVAAKTGTSSDYRDHWTIGFTSEYTVGVWKGNADGSPFKSKVSASFGTGPLFKQIMLLLHSKNLPIRSLTPESIEKKRVCSLSGKLAGRNCPSTRLEYFQEENVPHHACSYHREIAVESCGGETKLIKYTNFPEEYAAWAQANHLPTLQVQLAVECGWNHERIATFQEKDQFPKIVEPVSGTILAIDPTIPREHQKLRIQFAHTIAKEDIMLLVNGKPFKKLRGRSFIDWPLSKGRFNFQIQVGQDVLSENTKINVF
ncbi:MAG: penicillin-binding protein 1C [Bdellovibrionota bacterium]